MCESLIATGKRCGRKPVPVLLDADNERLLREVATNSFWSGSQIRRAEAVLGMAEGLPQGQIAGQIGFSVASIRRACRRFQAEGIAGLLTERQRTGRPRIHMRNISPNL